MRKKLPHEREHIKQPLSFQSSEICGNSSFAVVSMANKNIKIQTKYFPLLVVENRLRNICVEKQMLTHTGAVFQYFYALMFTNKSIAFFNEKKKKRITLYKNVSSVEMMLYTSKNGFHFSPLILILFLFLFKKIIFFKIYK